jgi:hypothetical protein
MLTDLRRPAHAALALVALAGPPAAAQTVDDVVRRYVEARGGAARLQAIESLRFTGTMQLPDVSAAFVLELARPNRMRTEFVVQGHTGVRAFDGEHAWEQLPLPGERPRLMSPEDAAEARAQADVDLSPLVDAVAKGFTVELEGRDRLPSGETWRLVVRGRDVPPRTIHLDAKTRLVVRTVDVRSIDGEPVEIVTDISDYRIQGGVEFPYLIEVGPRGKPERQRLVVQRIEVNPPLDASRFAMPAAPAVLP